MAYFFESPCCSVLFKARFYFDKEVSDKFEVILYNNQTHLGILNFQALSHSIRPARFILPRLKVKLSRKIRNIKQKINIMK